MIEKSLYVESKAIRDAARGEACTLNIAGACNYNAETTVLCHLPDEDHGMARKSGDLSGAFGCSACHDVIDGRVPNDEYKQHRDFYLRRGNTRTIKRLVSLGIITIAKFKAPKR